MKREILTAPEGKLLTDGEVYGKKIYLADEKTAEDFYEIPAEEYEQIMLKESALLPSAQL